METTGTGQSAAYMHSTHDRADFDIEALPERPQKRALKTNESYAEEWKYGSKARVIKYYLMYIMAGLIIGGIIGTVIGYQYDPYNPMSLQKTSFGTLLFTSSK
ncbi:hypothetical protein N7508_005237 [Penicillium antarcticum]|uniref:uncharacterized protein n=1 Tax=Penicillium antarcticum TaxID=416450 RepID=UPI002396B9D5|nr:uncharacterized protein N7508_005237 [Penicillium antarcticum]KAJ5306222.1 hypothetical protein N7508_005237 [Penicillium antarcticum]